MGAPRPSGPRAWPDADQPAHGPRPARHVEVPDRRRDREGARRPADAAGVGGRRRDRRSGGDVVRVVAGARRGRAARHHRDAPPGGSARRAIAGQLFRLDAVRRPDLADHDGRRGHPESRRHRPRPAHRQRGDRAGCARLPLLPELVADLGHLARAPGVRRRDGARVQAAPAALPGARQDQRRGHRPPERNARRHPHREDLHGGETRRARLHEGRQPPVSQHRAVDYRRVGDHGVLHGRRRRDRRHHDRRRRPRHPRGADDARRVHHLHLLHRPHGRARRADRRDRHADQRRRSPASTASTI